MREFTSMEKKVATMIIGYHEKLLTNCLYNILFDTDGVFGLRSDFYFSFDQEGIVGFYVLEDILRSMKGDNHVINEYFSKITLTTASVIDFIEYLIEQRYISVIINNKDYREARRPNPGYIAFVGMSKELQKKISHYENMLFLPTNKLSLLIKNRFVDEDGIRYRNEARLKTITVILTGVSIIIALGSLITSISIASSPNDNEVKASLINKNISITLDTPRSMTKCKKGGA